MASSNKNTTLLGVYSIDADGNQRLVHRYQGGDYGLEQIVEYFQLGSVESAEPEGNTVVALSAAETKQLKTMADAHSFDYDEGFIEMCLEMQRFVVKLLDDSFRFTANF